MWNSMSSLLLSKDFDQLSRWGRYSAVLLSSMRVPRLVHRGRSGLRSRSSSSRLSKSFKSLRRQSVTQCGGFTLASTRVLLFFLLWPLMGSWRSPLEPWGAWGASSDMPKRQRQTLRLGSCQIPAHMKPTLEAQRLHRNFTWLIMTQRNSLDFHNGFCT
jgi:hypothetical protein